MSIEKLLEKTVFNSRWLLAPFYLGLLGAILLLLVSFTKEFFHMLAHVATATEGEMVVGILSLIDMALIGNLLLIIIFSGYENFVSKIDTAGHVDRPEWMGHVDFSDLKMKVIGSIVAISAIELLKSFMHLTAAELTPANNVELGWKVGIHLTFVLSGVLFALMDWLSEKRKGH
ncbi:MAG: TIGR00645 family protein [Thiohalomonadaceae bacterium]